MPTRVHPHYRIALPHLMIEGRALSMERGTGVSTMIALAYLQCWDPDAVVAIYPAEHSASVSGPFEQQVEAAMGKAATRAWQVIVLGADADADGQPALDSAVVCARLSVLWSMARLAQPALMEMLDAFVPLVDLEEEDEALELIYAQSPVLDFAGDILAACPDHLITMAFDEVADTRPARQVSRYATARTSGSGLATALASNRI